MVFHGDYEVEFEIYETTENDARPKFLGYMVGISAYDAKTRWAETRHISLDEEENIVALYPPSLV
tara:strand:- start:1263 stop:1457 length:195 start_codon:yes stop_codon:yes gene_type:complete